MCVHVRYVRLDLSSVKREYMARMRKQFFSEQNISFPIKCLKCLTSSEVAKIIRVNCLRNSDLRGELYFCKQQYFYSEKFENFL